MTALVKPVMQRSGPEGAGCWAFDNTADSTSVSGMFYSLVVPDRRVAQLDDLSWQEEVEFWKLNFEVGRNALDRLESETGERQTLLLGVNDGYYVGQSIPHIHSHIVVGERSEGVDLYFHLRDMIKTFDTLRQQFSPAANPPQSRATLKCELNNIEDFTWNLKAVRAILREHDMNMFRIYTVRPLRAHFEYIDFAIDAGNENSPMFSFSQAWRALNGRMDFARLKNPIGRGKFSHIEPAPCTP